MPALLKANSKKAVDETEGESDEERRARKAAKKAARKQREAEADDEVTDTAEKKKRKRADDSDDEAPNGISKKGKSASGSKILSADEYRRQHDIRVVGKAPDPVQCFDSAGFNAELVAAVKSAGFTTPSAIQSQCWPVI